MTFFKGYPIGWIGWKLLTRLGVRLQLNLRIYDIPNAKSAIGFCINKDNICVNTFIIKNTVKEVKKELVTSVINNLMNKYKITSNIGIALDICQFTSEEECDDITKFKA